MFVAGKKVEKLKSMGAEKIWAQKFECVFVSQDVSQYVIGIFPFQFNNRQAASNAEAMLRRSSVWKVTTPAFDPNARYDYDGRPLKAVLLLKHPAQVIEVSPEDQVAYAHPACGLHQ